MTPQPTYLQQLGAAAALPQRPRRRVLLIVLVAAIVVAMAITGTVLALTLTRSGSSTSSGSDPGRQACQMMADDRAHGTTPDQARSDQELSLMSRSANADLRKAADLLKSDDLATQAEAIGPLYAGCAAVGTPLS